MDRGCTQTNAYIVWSLVSAGEKGLDKEIEYLLKLAKESNDFASDPYFLGLVAATLYQVHTVLISHVSR